MNEDSMLDCWLDMIFQTREELLIDKEFWAFLNGYLDMKMQQLLTSQFSIIESTVDMFVQKIKTEMPNQEVENLSIGRFLVEIKEDKGLLLKFSQYLSQELIAESNRINHVKEGDQNDQIDDNIGEIDITQKDGKGDANKILAQFMQRMKQSYDQNKENFDM